MYFGHAYTIQTIFFSYASIRNQPTTLSIEFCARIWRMREYLKYAYTICACDYCFSSVYAICLELYTYQITQSPRRPTSTSSLSKSKTKRQPSGALKSNNKEIKGKSVSNSLLISLHKTRSFKMFLSDEESVLSPKLILYY